MTAGAVRCSAWFGDVWLLILELIFLNVCNKGLDTREYLSLQGVVARK
ncbi:MAG: hypothetical protein RL088_3389, partial [Verrucomicrobiota bacterium]